MFYLCQDCQKQLSSLVDQHLGLCHDCQYQRHRHRNPSFEAELEAGGIICSSCRKRPAMSDVLGLCPECNYKWVPSPGDPRDPFHPHSLEGNLGAQLMRGEELDPRWRELWVWRTLSRKMFLDDPNLDQWPDAWIDKATRNEPYRRRGMSELPLEEGLEPVTVDDLSGIVASYREGQPTVRLVLRLTMFAPGRSGYLVGWWDGGQLEELWEVYWRADEPTQEEDARALEAEWMKLRPRKKPGRPKGSRGAKTSDVPTTSRMQIMALKFLAKETGLSPEAIADRFNQVSWSHRLAEEAEK